MDDPDDTSTPGSTAAAGQPAVSSPTKKKSRRGGDPANLKRRCISTACIACRKRKSKCDGALPSCAACASVYGTQCVYDPNSDHRRKGVYREKADSSRAQNSTLQVLIDAILNAAEDEVHDVVRRIRSCENLDALAEALQRHDFTLQDDEDDEDLNGQVTTEMPVEGERDLAGKMGELRLENGSMRFIGGTSHLIYLGDTNDDSDELEIGDVSQQGEEPLTSWSEVTKDIKLIDHLIKMYFNWHYPYFTTLSKSQFWRDFSKGRPRGNQKASMYCSSLLVNAMLALGCHFTNVDGAYAVPGDSRTKGDHFFAEAKRLIAANDEYEKPRLTTVQALALMSVREAGCAREAKGWFYSGISFRHAYDMGLNLDTGGLAPDRGQISEQEVDARRITFWGCFLFDKCWSHYLGRLPQLPKDSYSVPKYDVFPEEDAETWSPYTDDGFDQTFKQPARTRAVGLQLSRLCEISSDLLFFFYHPHHIGRSNGKAVELKKLSEIHRRLELWSKELPKEFEPKEGQLPNVILMHMFYHLQYIHLFRPFLKYAPPTSPLPSHVSPRRRCTAHAGAISKLMRLYKKQFNLRQICNIAVYMIHYAALIHLLNLPEKTAKRDIIHSVKHLEEIAEDWLCARRTLCILSLLARKWHVDLPQEASAVLKRTDEKYGAFNASGLSSPMKRLSAAASPNGHPASPTSMGAQNTPQPMHQLPQEATTDMMTNITATTTLPGMTSQVETMVGSTRTHDQVSMAPQAYALNNITMPMNMVQMTGTNQWKASSVSQPMTAATMYEQQQAFTSVQPNPGAAHGPAAQMTEATSPVARGGSIFAVDGQDWFIKDSVNWQQTFEPWMSHPMADQSMYTFRGLDPAQQTDGLDGVGDQLQGFDDMPWLE